MEKRKRGRPRKYPIVQVEKKKRGRPRKHPLIKEIIKVEHAEKKKPGRPKKIRTEISIPEVPPLNPPRVGKFVGYCNVCYQDLATFDGVFSPNEKDGILYTCWSCGNKQTETELLKDVPLKKSGSKYRNKKEYLEDCLSLNDDAVSFHGPEVINKKSLGVNDSVEPERTDEIFE